MSMLVRAALAVALLTGLAGPTAAQMGTERFIPIGRSPGVSGVSSYIGQIEAVDHARRQMTVLGPQGTRAFEVPEGIPIWLDRHAQRLTNLVGDYEDCEVGTRVEVKYSEATTADWVKVEVPPSG